MVVDDRSTSGAFVRGKRAGESRFGTIQRDLPFLKDVIDYRLTKHPQLYLFVERFRSWVNWDKRIYLSFVRKGDVVLDIGANVGAHSVFLSHLVGERGQVLAFEPLAPNIDAFRETIRRRSRIANITIVEAAVGNPQGEERVASMRSPVNDLTQASLQIQHAGSWEAHTRVVNFEVPFVSLDAHPSVRSLSRIDFIKIDVEGGELGVLMGARDVLRRHRPLVYCELYEQWARSFGYGPDDVVREMAELGYAEARAISKGRVVPLQLDRSVPKGLFDTSSDVLFFAERHTSMVAAFDSRYEV